MNEVSLPEQVDLPAAARRVATARVETARASRYLRALCNHFDRKVTASYDDNGGRVQFPFGDCEFQAEETALLIRVAAGSDDLLARTKYVVADHLERFGANEGLRVTWVETTA